MLLYTHGYHIDLEVYRLGVATWLRGGDMYGPLPPTISGLALPFIYPPFAAMVLLPLEVLPWTAAWIALYARCRCSSVAVTLYVVARRRPGRPAGRAGRCPSRRPALPAGAVARAGAGDLRVRPGQPGAHGARRGRLPGAAHPLAPRAAGRHRRGDQADPRGVRAVLPAPPRRPGRRRHGRHRRRRHRDRVRVDAASSARYWFGGPASGVSGSVFYTNQTIQAVLARAEVPALAAKAVWLVATVALLALIVPVVRRAEPALALVTVAGFALLVSPTSWSHHWVWIAPALLVVVVEAVRRRSRGWAAAAAVLAVTFYLAPFRFLPHEQDQELNWTATQQVVGATYVIVGILALVAVRVATTAGDRAAAGAP